MALKLGMCSENNPSTSWNEKKMVSVVGILLSVLRSIGRKIRTHSNILCLATVSHKQ